MTDTFMPSGHAAAQAPMKSRAPGLVPPLHGEVAVDGGLLRLIIIGVLLLGGCVMTIAQ